MAFSNTKKLSSLQQNKKGGLKAHYPEIGIFVFCLFGRLLLGAFIPSFQIIPDDFSWIYGSAYLAGYDWSAVVSSGYYGPGFSFLYIPFYQIVEDPNIRLQCFYFVNAILQSIPAVLCYRMLYNFYSVSNVWYSAVFSIAISFATVSRSHHPSNENAIYVYLWVCLYLLVYLQYAQARSRGRAVASILLGLFAGMSITAHTRAYGIIVCVIAIVLMNLLLFRVQTANPVILGISLCSFTIIAYQIDKYWQRAVYLKEGLVPNSFEALQSGMTSSNGVSLRAIGEAVGLTGTNLFASMAKTAFLLPVCGFLLLFVFFAFVKMLFIKKSDTKPVKLSNRIRQAYSSVECSDLLPGGLFSLMLFLGTLFIFILWWMPSNDPTDLKDNYMRGYFYLRYYFIYALPLLMYGAVFIYRKHPKLKTALLSSAILWLGCTAVTLRILSNKMQSRAHWQFDVFYDLAPLSFRNNQNLNMAYLINAIVFTVAIVFVACLLYKKTTFTKWLPALFAFLFMYQYIYPTLTFDLSNGVKNYNSVNASYELIPEITEQPSEIYVVTSTSRQKFVLQHMLKDYTIIPEEPGDSVENALIISDGYNADLRFREYSYTYLDGNEYLYVKGDLYLAILTGMGYEFRAANERVYDTTRLFVDREDYLQVGAEPIYLKTNETQFGPYIGMFAGRYVINLRGENLNGEMLRVYGDPDYLDVPFEILEASATEIVIEINLYENKSNVEFVYKNTSDTETVIESYQVFSYES